MQKRKRRPWSKNTDVWLNPAVIIALEELADWFGPGRSRTARYFLISYLVDGAYKGYPFDLNEPDKYLLERPVDKVLVRMPLRIFDNLLAGVNAKAKELGLSRSTLVRRILTKAVNKRIGERNSSLVRTLGTLGLTARREPWEKSAA